MVTPTIAFGQLSQLLSSPGFLFPQVITGLDQHSRAPLVMNMSFSIQRHIGWGTVVDVGYAGALAAIFPGKGTSAQTPSAPISIPPTPTPPIRKCLCRPRSCALTPATPREWGSSSSYHSQQASANRPFARGLHFGASWTWSKALDYNDTDFLNVSSLIPARIWNYGLASYDRTHVAARLAAEGCQFSGITSFVTGAPLGVGFTQVTATDITGSPTAGPRIAVTGNPVLPKSQRTF